MERRLVTEVGVGDLLLSAFVGPSAANTARFVDPFFYMVICVIRDYFLPTFFQFRCWVTS
jgi:hypothetical protein